MEHLSYDILETPIGTVSIVVGDQGLKKVFILPELWDQFRKQHAKLLHNKLICQHASQELLEYFYEHRRTFTVPLHIEGTEFSKKVWNQVQKIGYGHTASYSDIAYALDFPQSARAIGQANRHNPLPIFIPCHRIIAKNGALSGYLGNNTQLKEFLLHMEKNQL
jgi:methylated-DNA-[protein]-cysteine S-methyltransferase